MWYRKMQIFVICMDQWRNRQGGARWQGGRVPPETSDRKIYADLPGKTSQGKKGKGGKWRRTEGKL